MQTEYFQANRERFLEGLKAFLRIPSVSTLPEHKADVRQAAEFVREELAAMGMHGARLIEAQGRHPLVYAQWLEAPGKPTLLVYGHYDVQPVEPVEEWKSPPFEPTIRGEDIFARGACDDKGQTYLILKALEGYLKTAGRLPVNVRVLIEGEEEVGGEHIEEYVEAHAEELRADAALICDTEMFAPGLPTICVGLRGIVYGELEVRGARTDLHSGQYGGAAPNPLQAMAHILAQLKDREGRIRIPGFLDDVRPPSQLEQQAWARLPFDEAEYLEKEIGAPALVGPAEIQVLERVWAQPTVEVHGIRGGFIGEGAKTVIPARALAKLSMRLVPDQSADRAAEQLRSAVAAACPPGVVAEYRVISAAPPSLIDPSGTFIQAAAMALEKSFGRETVFIRSGGSIPIVGLFERHLGIGSVLMGFGLPDDNLHAPNEKFHLPNFYAGIEAVAGYLEVLGS
ncbi:MAG: dipeptidase [Acidimicrobiia bacterium]|nr:dipeptidase [Acidimicrobiia bacterium]